MDCRGGTADKQNKLGEGQIAKLSETAREALNGNAGADRCSYCGCVYFSPSRRILGFLDNYIRGDGWHGV